MYMNIIYIYIYIYIHTHTHVCTRSRTHVTHVHPVSITRFPLRRFSPGAGLLRNPFFYTINAKTFQGLGPKRRESCNGDRVYAGRATSCTRSSPSSSRIVYYISVGCTIAVDYIYYAMFGHTIPYLIMCFTMLSDLLHIYIYIHIHVFMYIYIYIHTYVVTYIYIYIYTQLCVYVYIYMYIHIILYTIYRTGPHIAVLGRAGPSTGAAGPTDYYYYY